MRLNHVTLAVGDVESSVRFYARLGLRQIVADYPDYARFVAPQGDTTLSLHHAEHPSPEPSGSIHFEVDDVDRAVDELKRAGLRFAWDPVDQPYLWREAILLDPDGHRVFIYHAGENRLDPPWRLAPDAGASRGSAMVDRAHGPSSWRIRSAGVQDIATVLDLWAAAGSLPTVSDSPDGLARLLASDPQALLVAELDGLLAGSLIAVWDGWRGSFYRLAVSPEHRLKGLATMLLREGERRLRERGAIRLTAIVADDEQDAMAFWRAAGYERQQQRARFVRHFDA